jgi:hypothetical protein
MPISNELADVTLSHPCPHCGHLLSKTGNWFRAAGLFTCAACRSRVQMTYVAKLKLFGDHARKHPPLT